MADLEAGPHLDIKNEEDVSDSPNSLSESYSNDEKKNDSPDLPQQQPQSVIVDWDGPDDPEFPQNL